MSTDATALLLSALQSGSTSSLPPLMPHACLDHPLILHSAVKSGNLETVKALPRRRISVESRDALGYTALHLTAINCDNKMMQILLTDFRADANALDAKGRTALHLVAQSRGDSVSCGALLLAAGADPNQTDATGRTPLFWAQARGNKELANQLGNSEGPGIEVFLEWGKQVALAHGLQPTAGLLSKSEGKKKK